MIGSIAGDVIQQSRIPVLVVRLPAESRSDNQMDPAQDTANSNIREPDPEESVLSSSTQRVS